MIKTMRLRNFKAFEDTGTVLIKPITVLAGPNSGGKSSILQSLLLLKQTLDAPPDIDLSLDGRFLQFSGFSDLTFGKPPLSNCSVSFEFGLETRIPRRIIPRYFPELELEEEAEEEAEEHVDLKTDLEFSFRYRKRANMSPVVLHRFDLMYDVHGEKGPRLTGTLKSKSLDYMIAMTGPGTQLPDHFKTRRIQTVSGVHFIPHFLYFAEDGEERGHLQLYPLNPIFALPFQDLQEDIGVNLEYLGPLRERPRRAYLHSGNTMTEIGDRGEYAAQILWIEKERKIRYLPAQGEIIREATLIEAVNDAFVNLGLFQSIDVNSEKSIMYQILFGLSGSQKGKSVTIADVGFGVSQLLPILVLGLRSRDSSLLILEQPEIHLHPRLQANLADFFLTLALTDRRLVIETHSDHFINRLRRRIAEDPTDTLKDIVNILFVHPPRDGRGAVIQPLRIDRFGVIENWPPDFLPEATDEAEAIFLAGIDKRVG